MSRVEEIEAAIDNLAPEEYRERENLLWDLQMDADSAAGKLDSLFNQADTAVDQGTLRSSFASLRLCAKFSSTSGAQT